MDLYFAEETDLMPALLCSAPAPLLPGDAVVNFCDAVQLLHA